MWRKFHFSFSAPHITTAVASSFENVTLYRLRQSNRDEYAAASIVEVCISLSHRPWNVSEGKRLSYFARGIEYQKDTFLILKTLNVWQRRSHGFVVSAQKLTRVFPGCCIYAMMSKWELNTLLWPWHRWEPYQNFLYVKWFGSRESCGIVQFLDFFFKCIIQTEQVQTYRSLNTFTFSNGLREYWKCSRLLTNIIVWSMQLNTHNSTVRLPHSRSWDKSKLKNVWYLQPSIAN